MPPNVVAIFPLFENPDHFERTHAGRYVCRLCPHKPNESPPTFTSEKAALAHEHSDDHVFCVDLEKNNPWNAEPAVNSADWGTEAGNDVASLTTEELKDLEYRRKVQQIPVTVERWRTGFVGYVRAGEMLPVDQPTPSPRRKSHKKKSNKSADVPAQATKADVSSEDERPTTVTVEPTTSPRDGSFPANHAPGKPANPIPSPRTTAPIVVPSPVPQRSVVAAAKPPPRRTVTVDSPRIELTPELHAWMADMVIEMRFSPTRARQMREFIQLPTNTKVDLVQRSAWDLRSLLFT